MYRIEKSYGSTAENDGMAQGYNGLSTYMSTNPSSLVSYHKMYGPESISINFVDFNNDDYIRSSLLGTRYLFGNAGYNAPQKVYTGGEKPGAKPYSKIIMHFRLDIFMTKNGMQMEMKNYQDLIRHSLLFPDFIIPMQKRVVLMRMHLCRRKQILPWWRR